jgi:hypothetical protein
MDRTMSTQQTIEAPSLVPHHTALGNATGTAPRPPFGFKALLRAVRAALQWRLLLWWTLLLLLPTIVAALPAWQMLSANLDHSIHASRLAARLDLVAITDLLGSIHERWAPAMGAGGLAALLLTLLLSPLLAGMTVACARRPSGQPRLGMSALLAGGAQEYGRMLRMLVWAAVPLGIAAFVGSIAFNAAGRVVDAAILESEARRASWIATAVAALVLLLAHATVDAGRAVLARDRRRTSAVLAWGAGLRLLLRRPLALLGTYLAITAAGLALAALLALARLHVPALGTGGTVAAFLLTQLTVAVLGWMRCARLFALMALARDQTLR